MVKFEYKLDYNPATNKYALIILEQPLEITCSRLRDFRCFGAYNGYIICSVYNPKIILEYKRIYIMGNDGTCKSEEYNMTQKEVVEISKALSLFKQDCETNLILEKQKGQVYGY